MKKINRVRRTSHAWFATVVTAAGLTTGSLNAAQIGINFQDDWGSDGGAAVTEDAQGVPAANWFNMPRVPNSGSTSFSTNQTISLPGGGQLNIAWQAVNTWSITADVPSTGGDDQLVYGYLDDTGTGYAVTLTGFRNFASSYTITAIASSDSADGFMNALVATGTTTNTLAYPNPTGVSYGSGLWAVSDTSNPIDATSGNNKATITGEPKVNITRSTLAGLVINYTPATANVPLVEVQPAVPAGTLFRGQPFSLTVQASGSQPLTYQWRKDGTAIANATNATLSVATATVADSGSYDVLISNTAGNATSTPVLISVSDATQPAITQGLRAETLYAGYPLTWKVQATGGQLAYAWAKDGNPIAGANTDTLTIDSLSAADQGTYTVTVSNPVGSASSSAVLTVRTEAVSSYEAAMVSRLPLVYFRMNEASVQLFDYATNRGSAGAGANGAYVGAVSRGVAGALAAGTDTAANFAGGRVVVPYSATLNPNGSFTAEVWAKPDNTTAANRVLIQSMVNGEYPENAADRSGWAFRQNGANLQFVHGGATLNPAAYYDTFTAVGVVTPGVWSHYALVYDSAVNTLTMFVNGSAVTNFTPSVPLEPNTAAPVMLGDRGYGGWTYAGALDEAALYTIALTPAQLLAHYQNGINPAPSTPYATLVSNDGAVLHLRLNEAAGQPNAYNAGTLGAAWNGTYTDASGKPASPSMAVGTVGPRPPEFEGFEAANVAVSVTNGFVYAPRVDLGNQVTAAVWVYREEPETGDGDLSWLAWLGDGGFHMNPDGELRYHWKGQQWSWASNLRVPVRTWTLAVLVVEPDQATIYMSEGDTMLSAVNSTTHAAMVTTSPLGFGGNQPGRADRHYRGKLDEAAVFNRALSAGEVSYLWSQATGAELTLQVVPGGVIEDSKGSGTPHHGVNRRTDWQATIADAGSPARTRTGVAQFSATTGSQIVVPPDADFNSATGTIMFWMKAPAPLPGPGNEGAILVDRRALGDAGGGDVIVMKDDGSIFVQAETPPGRTSANTFSVGYLPDDLWHHVAYVYDQSAAGSISIYIDGALAMNNPNTTKWAWAPAQPIEIGRSHDTYWRRFEGAMDDFRIYNRMLTGQEIGQVFANDATVDQTALKLRLNFTTQGIGESLVWPYGTLESSPSLGPDANWTPVPDAVSPYGFLRPTTGSIFYRVRL